MCTLNSKKSADIIDYIPESPEDPGANAKDNVRTWYRDAVAAYNHDMQTLSTLTNAPESRYAVWVAFQARCDVGSGVVLSVK